MARNHIQPGNVLAYTNSGAAAIATGALIAIGKRVGVALEPIAIGKAGNVQVTEVFEVTKEAGLAVAQGDLLYLKPDGTVNKTASGNTLAGYAFAAADAAAATVALKLNG